ncbi:MAG: hypothetical protein GOMPHAMPRED_007709 [Gomphillus americanus]|uniref:Cation efflux protein transmembrane domain-containing protein n=1 Tax=Gomphillus americanus TaxID=1940652 RepID=A0A8H3ETZ9_9LECA|nr:MAG: hypothetical protein GOMPHAMPRED_007709 [Gomphillus americanus]
MVGRRHGLSNTGGNIPKKYQDLESGGNKKSTKDRFRDVASQKLSDDRRNDLKKRILKGIDQGWFQEFRKSSEELKAIKNKKVRKFYEDQNQMLNDWIEVDSLVMAVTAGVLDSMDPDADHDGVIEHSGALRDAGENVEQLLPEDEREARRKANKKARWAININVIANVILLTAKVIAAFKSNSLSLIASLVDSALDLLCTLIVWTTNRLVGWRLNSLQEKFPVGRRRLEPLGILVFSIIMVISFLQILHESVTKLLPSGDHTAADLPPVAIGAMLATIILKGIIWFGCIPIKTTQVQALAQDCKTDVYFNTLSLLFPFIGQKAGVWWLDPAGAAILSLFIIFDWSSTCFDNVIRLSGSNVDYHVWKKLFFLAYRFSPVVDGFKVIRAYHAGDGVWTEMDLLLDEKTPLNKAHDIAETLQYCLEGLEEVDRAFVTTDYAQEGPTGHVNS